MEFSKILFCVVAALASTHANPGVYYKGNLNTEHKYIDYYAHPNYNYDYAVHDLHTGDVKNQWETRNGDVVKGSYSLNEPDGTIRKVEYTADDHNGFNAVVKKIGKSYHPEALPSYGGGHIATVSVTHGIGHLGATSYVHGNSHAIKNYGGHYF